MKDIITAWSTSFKCVNGWLQKSPDCDPNPSSGEVGCTYRYNGKTFTVAVNSCLKDVGAIDGVNPPQNSYKCVSKNNLQKSPDCDPNPSSGEVGCTYRYNGKTFTVAVNSCLKDVGAIDGVKPPPNSYKCVSKNNLKKDVSCAPKCNDYSQCWDGTIFGGVNNEGLMCTCLDPDSKTEKPSLMKINN